MDKERSIVTSLFRVIIVAVLLIFGIQITYQTIIFPNAYKYKVIDNIETELGRLYAESNSYNLINNLDYFSSKTQTSNLLLDADDVNINNLDNSVLLKSITVATKNSIVNIILPALQYDFNVGDTVSIDACHLINNYYYPTKIKANSTTVYDSVRLKETTIEGTVIKINEGDTDNLNTIKVDTFSDELFNYFTNNTKKIVRTNYGYHYISLDNYGRDNNIVYLSFVNVASDTYVLFTIYQLEQITYVTKELSENTIILYFLILLILLVLMNKYFRKISYPLKAISLYLKRISRLDFSNPLEDTKREDEIGEITRNINIMSLNLQNALKESERQKEQICKQMEREKDRDQINKDFVAGLSHELKTPLAVIKAASEGIALGIFTDEDELNRQYEVIQTEIDKCNRLIRDMIKVYEVEAPDQTKDFQECNIKDIILKIDNSLRLVAESKNLNVTLNIEDAVVLSDPSKLELVISNFYSNAIKYTDKNNEIIITLKQEASQTFFSIINTGTHIPEDSIDNLFEPFYRVNKARSRELGSTGLGLYIVKQIFEHFGYEYGVQNIKEGVEFFFTIKNQ